MHSAKYLSILALLGVVQVAGKNQKSSTMAQVSNLNRKFQEFDGSMWLQPADIEPISDQQQHHTFRQDMQSENLPTFSWSDSMLANLQPEEAPQGYSLQNTARFATQEIDSSSNKIPSTKEISSQKNVFSSYHEYGMDTEQQVPTIQRYSMEQEHANTDGLNSASFQGEHYDQGVINSYNPHFLEANRQTEQLPQSPHIFTDNMPQIMWDQPKVTHSQQDILSDVATSEGGTSNPSPSGLDVLLGRSFKNLLHNEGLISEEPVSSKANENESITIFPQTKEYSPAAIWFQQQLEAAPKGQEEHWIEKVVEQTPIAVWDAIPAPVFQEIVSNWQEATAQKASPVLDEFYQNVYQQVKENPSQEFCKVSIPAEQKQPEYTQIYTAYYEEPLVDLFFHDKPTGQYFKTTELSPMLDYYEWDTPSQQFKIYEPTPVDWNRYYQTPESELFYYDNGLEDYIHVKEPSPYIEYLTVDQNSGDFIPYVPQEVEWNQIYDTPAVDLYSFEPQTETYSVIEEPSPFTQYYYMNEITQTYQPYIPETPAWTERFEEPLVDLHVFDRGMQSYVPVSETKELSPLSTYFIWDEHTQDYIEYEPTPVVWTQYYEVPAVTLFKQESATQAFKPVPEPSPYIPYVYLDQFSNTFQEYEPVPVVWNDYYQEPQVPLYTFDQTTSRFVPESKPSPYIQYYSFEPETKDYVQYEPTPVVWTDYYEPPQVDLYWKEASTRTYVKEDVEPSPYVQYFVKQESTQCATPANPTAKGTAFIEYEPTPVQWTKYYEEPIVDLYYYEPETKQYVVDENPSPYNSYVFFSEETQEYGMYEPVEVKWTDYYEPSVVPLFSYDQSTKQYLPEPNPSPYVQNYYLEVPTQSYIEYEPVPAVWEEHYQTPAVDLFWYDQSTKALVPEDVPSPFVDYVYYEPAIQSYAVYEPTPVVWTDQFEAPQTPLYFYDTATKTYNLDIEPSPIVDYYVWNENTQQFQDYAPTPIVWTDYYEQPITDLYTVSPVTQQLSKASELSPYNNYVYIDEQTGQILDYVPQPVVWTDYYETPHVDLYIQNPSTQGFEAEPSPSPYQNLFFYDEGTQKFEAYEPTPIIWNEYYEEPEVPLFYYDTPTSTFVEETEEPSPKVQYYQYSEESAQYIEFVPTPIHWEQYYDEPEVTLFYFDNSTEQFIPEQEEPSPVVQYFQFDSNTKNYDVYVPSQADWADKYYEPEVEIYYYEPVLNEFIEETEPSPNVQYYEWNEKTSEFIEYEPTPIAWTDFYEEPTTDLYRLDTTTRQYFVDPEPSPMRQYKFWSESTNQYEDYVPQVPAWTDLYELPVVDLYYKEPTIDSYVVVDNPSPLENYVYYNELTQDYTPFVPEPVSWNEYYETPQQEIFYFDVPTQTFQPETAQPSPYAQYYQFNENDNQFEIFQPTQIQWDHYFEEPQTDLYYYDKPTQSYIKEATLLSPKVDYYERNERTGQYRPFDPVPIEWTRFNVEPEVQLYSYDEETQTFIPEAHPSPFVDYHYWNEETREYAIYEPTPLPEENIAAPTLPEITIQKIKPITQQQNPQNKKPTLDEYCLTRIDDQIVPTISVTQQAQDHYLDLFNAHYEEPVRDLFYVDESTGQLVKAKDLSPSEQYFFYNEPLESYTEFTPTPANWDEYYAPPPPGLVWYDEETDQYVPVKEPSPYIDYLVRDEETHAYVPYEPTPLVWTDTNELPVVDLYWVDESTGTFNLEPESELSPTVNYYYWNEATTDFVEYQPQGVSWTDYYEEPEVKLYYYEPSINSYVHEKEPSPYVEYQFYNERTKSYIDYDPVPVVWEDYYETPEVDLFYFDEPTQTYNLESSPSPYGEFFYYEPDVQQFVYYEPTISKTAVICVD